MNDNDDNDDNDKTLQIIPSNQLRLIPLYVIITHIYEKIIEATFDCEFTYAFNIDQLIKNHELNTKIATPSNKTYIINEIKRLFPGIKITEIGEKYNTRSHYNSYWSASWEEELEDIVIENNSNNDKLESYNGDDCDDIILKQAIQESLKEVKKTEKANNSIILEKTEERLQKARQKYKKLYK
jgi:hypothetical protein